MARLSIAVAVVVSMVLILDVSGEKKAVNKRDTVQVEVVQNDDVLQWFCQNNPFAAYFPACNQYSTTTPISATSTSTTVTPASSSASVSSTSSFTLATTTMIDNSMSSSSSASSLERAHWCGFSNGSYIPLGYTFMYTACALCQCTQSRIIRCNTLQCMPTYCIDNSIPNVRSGQCCAQCAYDVNSTSCVQNGVTFPHGTILKTTSDNLNCWCQLGTVECRKMTTSALSGLDLWGNGTAVYVVIVILCVLLIVGTLLCGGCTLIYYYYYRYNQQSIQQAYGEYWNNAGWQPMGEEEQVVDPDAEKKQAEAEQGQFGQEYPTGNAEAYIPPPYALYNGSYTNEQTEKDQKHV